MREKLSGRRASVSLLFAIAIVPLLMLVGLAIDFGFYNEAQSQLNLAADAAAMHAARVAAVLQQQNDPAAMSKGQLAGTYWFTAQEGSVPQAQNGSIHPSVLVQYNATTNQISAQVSYIGVIITHFARLFGYSGQLAGNWGIAGAATAVISIPSFVEVDMLLDNSSSMLIAATPEYIQAMEQLTPCSQQSANEGQQIDFNYSWAYTPTASGYVNTFYPNPANSDASALSTTAAPLNNKIFLPYGYGSFVYPSSNGTVAVHADVTPPLTQVGQCDVNFSGPTTNPGNECLYPATLLTTGLTVPGQSVNSQGQCTLNGVVSAFSGGGPGTIIAYPGTAIPTGTQALPNMPQAPCAFACHNQQDTPGAPALQQDYYALAEANHIQLRYDILQTDAANVITKMQTSQNNSQLTVGVYQFNAPNTANAQPLGITQVYPTPTSSSGEAFAGTEAGPVMGQNGENPVTLTAQVLPPVTGDAPDTDFESAMTNLGDHFTAAGSGTIPTAPRKNLFIVTDGLDDNSTSGTRVQGPINPAVCSNFKNPVVPATPGQAPGLGVTVYVLYIQYYPLPNPYYLYSPGVRSAVEPIGSSQVEAALQACASPGQYYTASGDSTSINNALQTMLAAALGSSGYFSK